MNLPSAKLVPSGMPRTESPLQDLEAMIRSRMPLIAVESNEEPQIVRMVRQIGNRLQTKTYRWTVTEGLQAFDPCDQPRRSVMKSQELLEYIRTDGNHCLFVLLDFHPYLKDAVHMRQLKDIALTYQQHYSTVVLVGYSLQFPEELKPYIAHLRLPLPNLQELRAIVVDVAGEWGERNGHRDVQTTNKAFDLLVRNLAGLTATDARRLAMKAVEDGVISESDIPEVLRAKYELLGGDSLLSFEYDTAKFSDIGGMLRLRHWLETRRSFLLGEDLSLDPPRGMLLLGVQGCGKSLAAKAAAGIFGVPLLRLDFGVLYNKYYGETERNLRKALETAEIMAPCVLWMDEIEKGVAVSAADDDGGVSRRILGALLTWMAEKKKPVFLVATANDIERLPPELIRKGRFDEIFFVDLPSQPHRREILEIHLRKRHLKPAQFDLDALSAATEGFSGSEIEQAIVSATYAAHAEGREVAQEDVLAEVKQTRPLSVIMSEKVEALRDWASSRTVGSD
ncbi:MAG TPA: AAA family ATPase [Candidatus Angelobacter sp.]|nr:AAA family ATPase [Candidatus Angelobacter sp.]